MRFDKKAIEWMKTAFDDASHTVSHLDGDDILKAIGVEKRRSATARILPAIGFIGAGLAVGAGLAFALFSRRD